MIVKLAYWNLLFTGAAAAVTILLFVEVVTVRNPGEVADTLRLW